MKSYTYHDIYCLAQNNDIVVVQCAKDSSTLIVKNWIMELK